jgi:hypothetical protein
VILTAAVYGDGLGSPRNLPQGAASDEKRWGSLPA